MHVESEIRVEDAKKDSTPAPLRRPSPLSRSTERVFEPLRPSFYANLKRGLEVLLALTLLLLTSPLLLLAALIVKLTSRGPVLYWQTRMGLNGQPFTIVKIRTMYHDCEKKSGARWCKPGDPRIIPFGRLLRKLHIDELPQLWNILRGDMSLIGPRPERPEFLPQLEKALPRYRDRLQVRPGLTGLAQVQLPPDTDLNSARLKLAYDLFYVRKMGFWLDVRVLLGTALHVIGLPWGAVRFLALLPRRKGIEREYRETAAERQEMTQSNATHRTQAV